MLIDVQHTNEAASRADPMDAGGTVATATCTAGNVGGGAEKIRKVSQQDNAKSVKCCSALFCNECKP